MRYFVLIIVLFSATTSIAQKANFSETFNNNKNKWSLPATISKDSATLKIDDGSLLFDHRQSKRTIIGIPLPKKSKINLDTDQEWTITLHLRHMGGVNNYDYGIHLGEVINGEVNNGTFFGIASTGYFLGYNMENAKYSSLSKWTAFSTIKKADNEVNEIKLIKYRGSLAVLINGYWAFRHTGTILAKSIGFFVSDRQKIVFDDITIESIATVANKKEKDLVNDLLIVAKESNNSFAASKGFKTGIKYDSWLPRILIGDNAFMVFEDFAKLFLKKESTSKNRVYYQVTQGFSAPDRQTTVTLLQSVIKKALGDFTESVQDDGFTKSTYWFSKNEQLPAGLVIIISEFMLNESSYVELTVVTAPDVTAY